MLAISSGTAFRPVRSQQPATGLLRNIADGAAVLRAHPQALRLVGADITCSLVYGMQTVLLLLVSSRTGLGLHGYGYLFAGLGAGGLMGTALASRALRSPHPRAVLVTALTAVGLPKPLLAITGWPMVAIALVSVTGAGAILVEILTETALQRMLPPDMFGRAYGLALPASLGGIVAGSLIAPLLTSLVGGAGALVACGVVVGRYALQLRHAARRRPGRAMSQPEVTTTDERLVTALSEA